MERISAIGADVTYILTGIHAETLGLMLSPDEQALLNHFRDCEEADQNAIRQLARRSAEAVQRNRPRTRPDNPQQSQAVL